jgi:hypothetical protein
MFALLDENFEIIPLLKLVIFLVGFWKKGNRGEQ